MALTVTAGEVQLLLIAPDAETKRRWVNGLKAVVAGKGKHMDGGGTVAARTSGGGKSPTVQQSESALAQVQQQLDSARVLVDEVTSEG